MKTKLKLIFSIIILPILLIGQNREIENKYFKIRDEIKEAKIKSISEFSSMHSFGGKDACSEVDKWNSNTYHFDKEGNLSKVENFGFKDSIPRKIIKYVYDENGHYIEKSYIFLDSIGNIKNKQDWEFKYDKTGLKIKEILMSDDKTILMTNHLKYDKKGNVIEQFRDNRHKWIFKYDDLNRVKEHYEWSKRNDTLVCLKSIKFNYSNNQLISEISASPEDSKDIWEEKEFVYASNRKLKTELKTKASWVSRNYEPTKKEFRDYQTTFEYNDFGLLKRKYLYRKGLEKPYRCFSYKYEFQKK